MVVLGTYNRTTSFDMDLGASTTSMRLKELPLKELNVDSGKTSNYDSTPSRLDLMVDAGLSTVSIEQQ